MSTREDWGRPPRRTPRRFEISLNLWLAIAVLVLLDGSALFLGFRLGESQRPHTQVIAVCDSRGHLVYETNTGSVFVLEHC